ncbi:hypothetical protein [Rhodococcus sp. B10]|uniref:zinc finger domain-containing protein n=1 Tax=Rhodococcus sp. B10 TaxID=2695876 RepID=UPI00143119D7|nr:hypothetical protein [Rhodococcus sp. B10]NIL77651.1 hypothetical protein [Rhodococcus sp. B10]
MTAAHNDAGIVACPDCHAPVRSRCVWPDGRERRTPCLNRLRAADRYDGAVSVGSGLTDLDEPEQRDITEPLHPQEDQ